MSKNKKIILLVLIFLSFFVLFFYSSQTIYKNKVVITSEGTLTARTFLEINGVSYEDEVTGPVNVYDFMTRFRSEGKITFKDKTYSGLGKFIEELNGVRGNGEKFWIYYVNGKRAEVGVSKYKIYPGDVVSWRYEKDIINK